MENSGEAGDGREGLRRTIASRGFRAHLRWQDRPGASYPDYEHAAGTAHIILDAEMTLTTKGESQAYHAGGRCDVPAGAVHSAKIGPRGCRYLIGERAN